MTTDRQKTCKFSEFKTGMYTDEKKNHTKNIETALNYLRLLNIRY